MQRLRRLFCDAVRRNAYFWQHGRRSGLAVLFVVFTSLRGLLAFSPATGQTLAESPTPVLSDSMDGQTPVLLPLTTGTSFRIGQRSIDRKTFRHGSGSERIQLSGPAGRTAQLGYQIPPAPVIQELHIQADVLTNRAGVQLAARVVLPRSKDSSTGRPFELLVRGGNIASGGRWEVLTLGNFPRLLANHARVARAQHGATLDERGAYVSQVVLLAPGGSGMTELIVDRIQLFGVLNSQDNPSQPNKIQQVSAQPQQGPRMPSVLDPPRKAKKQAARIPRIIQWQGESFQMLQQLGFNTISISRLPSDDELQQADRLGVSLFCPPPTPEELSERGITEEFDSVLAWNLGEQISSDDLAYVDRWEELVSRHDPQNGRPTVLAPQLHTLEASRIADVMLVGRPVVGTELTIREHTAWLTQRQRLARPGTPLWTRFESQPSPSQQLQIAALSSQDSLPQETTYSQLVSLTSSAFGIKTQGFYFESQASLAGKDSATQRRAMALELTNLRLQLAEPWLVAGKERSSARSTQPELSALVLQAERSHLLVPVWWSLNMRSAVHPRVAGPVSFVVPGVAESSEAFLVTLGGMQRVRRQRVTGGVRVSLEELPLDSFLMFTDDPQAISQVTRYLRRIGPRASKLRRDLAQLRLQEAISLTARLGAAISDAGSSQRLLKQSQLELGACDRYLRAKSYELAYHRADAVELLLEQLESELQTQLEGPQTLNSAQSYGPIALPDRLQLQHRLARAPVTSNLLVGGGFENLSAMLEHGWRHQQLPLDGITTSVRLSPEAPHSGSYCLELEARSLDENAPATIVPTSPVWIASSPLSIRAGDLVEITGVVRLPEPLLGTVDGLQIIDSLGGPDMALRIQEAPSWQPFRLIRAATSDAQVSVTIALSGLGKAQIDDVAVRVIQRK